MSLADIRLQVMWNRLISVVEEQALTLIRTAFSTSVREAGDLSAGIFDPEGRMIAQAVTGTPGHVNTMEAAVRNFLDVFPPEERREGDDWITNDPWLGTGHLHDITMVTPSFHKGRLVGYFACTAHVVDVGGRGFGADAKSVYEEGIQIPIMKFAAEGTVNRELIRVLEANLREPGQVIGDCYSLAACNQVGHRRLVDMLAETDMDDLAGLAAFVFERSEAATLERINALPQGRYLNEMRVDGYDEPLDLKVALTISNGQVHADYEGTSAESRWGINVPMIYAKAYTAYGLKCAIAPEVPNNTASLAPFTMTAPPGCILNAQRPAPVALRHVVGQMLPDVVLGALDQALPDHVPAEGASSLWNVHFSIRPAPGHEGRRAEVLMFNSGGTGARPRLDGLNATAFPSGVMTMPIEATEHTGPITFWRKELRPGSGGPGRQRGGLGQILEIEAAPGHEFDFSAMFDRCHHPARGRQGGGPGGNGVVRLDDGTKLRPKGWQHVPAGRRLILEAAGGAGYGPASERSDAALKADLEAGYVTEEEVRASYGRDPATLED